MIATGIGIGVTFGGARTAPGEPDLEFNLLWENGGDLLWGDNSGDFLTWQ